MYFWAKCLELQIFAFDSGHKFWFKVKQKQEILIFVLNALKFRQKFSLQRRVTEYHVEE